MIWWTAPNPRSQGAQRSTQPTAVMVESRGGGGSKNPAIGTNNAQLLDVVLGLGLGLVLTFLLVLLVVVPTIRPV